MRLFIAIEIPEDVSEKLHSLQERLIIPGKATKTRSFHLTLKFLGDVEEEKLSILIEELSKISFQPFEASLSKIGAFPNTNNPRVVWLGLEPHEIINSLQKQVDLVTQKLGFEADKKFHPHLTLARIKFLKDKRAFKDTLEDIAPPSASFKIDSFKLIRSTLTPEGPVYEVLESFKSE
jgi:RNA 2',3'-cyclic 3'-phosphodiesterase